MTAQTTTTNGSSTPTLTEIDDNPNTALALRPADQSFALALEPGNLEEAFKVAEIIAKTGICKVADANDVMVRIMTGRSLGLSAMTSLRAVYVVEGTPTLSAAAKEALVRRSPDCELFECVESTDERCVYRVKRRGCAERLVEFTLADAIKGQLMDRGATAEAQKKSNWNRWTKRMLIARCRGLACDMEWPHVGLGIPSTEEMLDERDRSDELVGEVVPNTPKVNAAARDFAGEGVAMFDAIQEATGANDMKAIRGKIEAWDGPAEMKADILAHYNERASQIRKARAEGGPKAPGSDPAPGQS